MVMFDDRFEYGFGWFWHIGSFLGGLILVAGLVVVGVLLVRYLIVATRAAQVYLDAHEPKLPATTPPAATEPPPATTTTKPTARTPKTPPAAG
jgi:hypothetical protein